MPNTNSCDPASNGHTLMCVLVGLSLLIAVTYVYHAFFLETLVCNVPTPAVMFQ